MVRQLSNGSTACEERLLALLRRLPKNQAQQLLDNAELLLERYGVPEETAQPQDILRPECETVIQVLKRLRASEPMLDRRMLLDETSVLMAQHTLQRRDVVEVIDEMEV